MNNNVKQTLIGLPFIGIIFYIAKHIGYQALSLIGRPPDDVNVIFLIFSGLLFGTLGLAAIALIVAAILTASNAIGKEVFESNTYQKVLRRITTKEKAIGSGEVSIAEYDYIKPKVYNEIKPRVGGKKKV